MKKAICLLLMAIMVISLVPVTFVRDALAVPTIEITGDGSYYYDGHPKTVQAKVKGEDGFTVQYSFYSVYDKATWSEDAPSLTQPGTMVVYVRAIKDKTVITADPVILEVVGNAPVGSAIQIITGDDLIKAPVYEQPNGVNKLGELDNKENCSLLGQDGDWFKVSNGSVEGYVYFEYITILSKPNDNGGGVPDLDKVEIEAYGGTFLYDGTTHYVHAILKNAPGFILEFSVDNGKTWTTKAPGLTEPGRITVKVHAILNSVGVKELDHDVVLQVLATLPEGTDVKIKAHGSNDSAPIRETPATSGKKLGSVDAGTTVKFIAREGDWIKISHDGIQGYVYYWFVDLENVEIRPVITTQPKDTWAIVNENVTFTVVAEGTGTLSYKWEYYNTGTGIWEKAAGESTGASYTFKAVTADNGMKLRCAVSDSNGKTYSKEAVLTVVTGAPTIDKHPMDSGNLVGKYAVFTVSATGAQRYKWQYRKDASDTWKDITDNESAKTAALSVKVTNDNNGYQFRCIVGNTISSVDYESTSNHATLYIVKEKVKIQAQPYADAKQYNEGDTVTLKIIASGDAVSYKWQRKLKGKDWEDCPGDSAKTDTYKSDALTWEYDGAQYRCLVWNPLKPKGIKSKTVKIKVISKPTTFDSIEPTTLTATVVEGTSTTFKVTLGDPKTGKIKFKWMYCKAGDDPSNPKNWKKCSKGSTDTLVLTKIAMKLDGYRYRCVVTRNNTEATSSTITLYVIP